MTAEIGPPRGADPDAIRRKVEPLRGWVDAVNITDNQGAFVRLSSWAGSLLALAAGVEPVMQLTCRDRNRIALQSDLLGAAAMGIPQRAADDRRSPEVRRPPATPSPCSTWTASSCCGPRRGPCATRAGCCPAGSSSPAPGWLIGAVENPFAPPARFRAARLGKKVAAGAEFVQTQYVFDVPRSPGGWPRSATWGWTSAAGSWPGVGPVRSLRALEHMAAVPGVHVPDEIARRLRGVPAEPGRRRGAADLRGDHPAGAADPRGQRHPRDGAGFERGIPQILDRAGLAAGRIAGTRPSTASGHAH